MRLALLVFLLLPFSVRAQVGTLNASFGDGGIVVDSLSAYDDAYGLAILPSGDLVAVGSTSNNTPQSQSARSIVYDASGERRTTFAHDYLSVACQIGQPEAFYNVVVESDTTLLVSGFTQTDCAGPQRDFWVHRLDKRGSRAFTFDRPAFRGGAEYGYGLVRQPDGHVVVAGSAQPARAGYSVAFARFTPTGAVDPTFGTGGETLLSIYDTFDQQNRVAIHPDGGIVATGYAYDGSVFDVLLVRLTADGLPDPAFGVNGVLTLDYHGGADYARDLAIQSDGNIVVTGTFTDPDGVGRGLIARFLADGTPDPTFGTGGTVTLDVNGLPAYAYSLVLQSDGKIVVAGGTETGAGGAETIDVVIARLLPDGTLDPGFGTGGMQVASWGPGPDYVRDLAIAPNGDLVVFGSIRETVGEVHFQNFALARFIGDVAPVANEEDPVAPAWSPSLTVAPSPTPGPVGLTFELAEASPVELAVYDLLGRRMTTVLHSAVHPAGTHEVSLDASSWPSGVYFVRLVAGGELATQRLTVIR